MAAVHSILGEKVTTPVEIRVADAASAMFLADVHAARNILGGTGLVPVTIAGRAICTLVFVRYIDGDLGPYHEFGLAVMAQLPGDRSSIGIYISWLPVNQPFTLAAGREIWGFPKEMADIRITSHGRGKRCEVLMDGRLVVALETSRSGGACRSRWGCGAHGRSRRSVNTRDQRVREAPAGQVFSR